MDSLNKNSKAAAEDRPKARFRTRDISIRKLYSNEKNFYSMQDIEKMAQDIMVCGLLENLTVKYAPCDSGEYRIIAGERRWRALMLLFERGYSEFEIVTCQVKASEDEHEEIVQLIMANAYRDKTVMDILEEEKRLKESLQYMKDNKIPLNGYSLESGRLRDVIAQIMNTTTTKVAQIESINKRLIPEFSKELKEGRLTFSAAYELSGMKQEKQQDMLERYRGNGLTWKEVKEAKAAVEEKTGRQQEEAEKPGFNETEICNEFAGYSCNIKETIKKHFTKGGNITGCAGCCRICRNRESCKYTCDAVRSQIMSQAPVYRPGDDYEDPHPESITSLCYSCNRYSDCNVKTGTCKKCDQYINKAEAEKTDEQRYDEEQKEIDKKTREKLREKEQEEAMKDLLSDEKEEKFIRVSAEMYKNIESCQIPYMIVKEAQEKYREKDILTILEFKDGKETGKQLRVCITCVDNADTSSGIVEGYAVIGVMDIYDAEGHGLIDLEDEE